MDLDDEVCLCFHVSLRKILSYVRVEKPSRLTQVSNCLGAGTGCGWCRPVLKVIFEQAAAGAIDLAELPDAPTHASQRADYLGDGGGAPPDGDRGAPPDGDRGATPLADSDG